MSSVETSLGPRPDAGRAADVPVRESGGSRRPVPVRRRSRDVNVSDAERGLSVATGLVLVAGALVRRGLGGAALGIVGASLLHRGTTGRCAVYRRLEIDTAHGHVPREIELARSVTVETDPEAVRRFWSEPGSLERVTSWVDEVRVQEGGVWQVTLLLPGGRRTELTVERGGGGAPDGEAGEGETRVWRSPREARIGYEVRIACEPAPGDRGTEVGVHLRLRPPGGAAGTALGRALEGALSAALGEALRRMKQILEAGETATIEIQPAGPRSRLRRALFGSDAERAAESGGRHRAEPMARRDEEAWA